MDTPLRGTGSGVFIEPDGHILTNYHVIEGADRITVKLADGRTLRAHVVGSDPDTDIALIKVEGSQPFPAAALGDSDTLRVGEWVCAIGNPLAYEHTVTVGVVSFIGRKLFDKSLDDYIQTDAAINFGNSGGPLINTRGEVIGINSAISSRASNIGFAVPMNQARAVLPQLKQFGRVARGFIGVSLKDVDPDLQRSLNLGTARGALVQDVTENTPGARAGLKPYDLITAIDGTAVATNDELIRVVSSTAPGADVRLDVVRDGRAIPVSVRLAERPVRNADPRDDSTAHPSSNRRAAGSDNPIGVSVRDLDRDDLHQDGTAAERARRRHPARRAAERRIRREPRARAGHPRGEPAPGRLGHRLPPSGGRRARGRCADVVSLPARRGGARAANGQDRRAVKSRILVIDDESAIRDSLKMILEYDGYDVQGAATGQDGLVMVDRDQPELVLLDIKMAGMDGLEVLQRLKAGHEALPVVMISGHATVSTAVEATKLGAFDFIEKPLSTERVLVTVRNALDRHRLVDENITLRKAQEVRHQLVGESAALRGALDAVKRAAPTTATVLITGESGVGKELVARAIHRNSLRARERFVQVNCAAIPDDLIESELFGHEKGSFTGATEKQVGKFEQADKGTIFLDEVGDMSLKTQAKVLRVLQEGEVERLGSARTTKVDVRVIAATNKNLEEEVERGNFREDLYFRLNVIPIHVPPLRERPEDVPALVRHFLDLSARENNLRPRKVSEAAIAALQRFRWRGNIRELRNTIERLVIMTPGDVIDVGDLPSLVRVDAGARPPDNEQLPVGTLREHKEVAERAFLVQKLRETGWNISKTADLIDTPRSNLYKKLEQYRISQETDG